MTPTHPIVKKLKKIIDTKELLDGDKFLRSVWKAEDTSLILPLMLMRNYRSGTEHLDEMWLVIHTVEAYPLNVFIHHLVTNIDMIAEKSPYLLNHIFHGIKNNKKYLAYFLKEIRRKPPAKVGRVITILERVRQNSVKFPEKVVAVDRMIAVLRE